MMHLLEPSPPGKPVVDRGYDGKETRHACSQRKKWEDQIEAQEGVDPAEHEKGQAKDGKPNVHDSSGAEVVDEKSLYGSQEATLQPGKGEGQG